MYINGTSVNLSGGAEFNGNLYAPRAQVVATSDLTVHGSVFSGSFESTSNTTVRYDRAVTRLADSCVLPSDGGVDAGPQSCTTCLDCRLAGLRGPGLWPLHAAVRLLRAERLQRADGRVRAGVELRLGHTRFDRRARPARRAHRSPRIVGDMEVVPLNIVELVAVLLSLLSVLIPVAGLTARFALKPIVEALSVSRGGRNHDAERDAQLEILEKRMALLERQLETAALRTLPPVDAPVGTPLPAGTVSVIREKV